MKTKIIITVFAVLFVQALYAQELYRDGNKIILDLTEAAGMPAGSTTNQSKTELFELSPNTTGVYLDKNLVNGSINATVFGKLEIAPADLNRDGNGFYILDPVRIFINPGWMIDEARYPHLWADAWKGCVNLNKERGEEGWRLPTQRELYLIAIFNSAIADFVEEIYPDFYTTTFYTDRYVSATEAYYNTNYNYMSIYVSGSNNFISYPLSPKSHKGFVRCVREIPH
ncbi:DUF1566 domain-containing protein [Bacteroides sp. 519]|uniref:Lcl domain-containing protein n=1 Tax=Bacteroides sp. 519 TaxID=2302937 RepID=UPI0013D711AA|nr:DUF1566 domain-containing protein [Bacteroides sp. 519]NDV56904.1 DUF1566 domain-containing protein [Bacteroides sp. 519]